MKDKSETCLLDLQFRGFIEGLTYLSKNSQPLCHFFGGIPYALPPIGPFRFQKPRPLPPCYRYGTRSNPGSFTGNVSLCPQPNINDGDELDDSFWDEDCLQANVWIPIGKPPEGGWPVLFWIHGGFLQFGTPRNEDLTAMLSETRCEAIVVTPAYRLNLFGFLASPELCEACPDVATNVGFWDQRLALEWTWQNISYFGGNASNITVGGYSAGSHSTFHQLAYDIGLPDSKSVIRRALMLSNGPGMQPKSLEEAQTQCDELLTVLDLPLSLHAQDKLKKLREIDPKTLVKATLKMKLHQFRGVTDGSFIRHRLLHEIDAGLFARIMKRRNVKLIIGECRDEHFVYGSWRPPSNTLESLFERLQADYPLAACEALFKYYYPDGKLPSNSKTWPEAFGRIYADIQIHCLERGMVDALVRHGAGDLIFRYRMEWRAQCCDLHYPREWGVTHGTDMAIWFWGSGNQLSKKEKVLVKKSFHDNFAKFLKGEQMDWGTKHPLHIRTLTPEGTIVCQEDPWLQDGVKVWDVLKRVGLTGLPRDAKL